MLTMRAKIIDGLVWGFGGRIILLFFNFVTIVVTARLLSPTEFGVYATAQIFIDLGYAVANSTLGTPIVRAPVLNRDMEQVGFAAFIVSAIVLSAAMGLGSTQIAVFFAMPELAAVMVALSLAMPFRIMSGYYVSVMLQRMHMRAYQISQTLPQLLGLLLTIAMASYGFGIWSLVGGFAVSTVAELLISIVFSGAQNSLPRTISPLREYWRIGSGTLAARGASSIASSIDKAIIANLIDAAAVGLYTRAFSIMMIPFKVITLVATRVFLTSFSKIDDAATRSKALEKILALQAYVYIPMSAGLWLVSDFLIRAALGNQWLACIPICQILSCALFARLGYEVINNALTAVGRVWSMAAQVAASIPVMFTFCVLGYYLAGLQGIAIGVSFTLVFVYGLSLFWVCKLFKCATFPVVRAHIVGFTLGILAAITASSIPVFPIVANLPEILTYLQSPIYFSVIVLFAWITMPRMFLGMRLQDWKDW